MKLSDKYLKIVEWSEEDGCYLGHCPGLMVGGVHGHDETNSKLISFILNLTIYVHILIIDI